MESDSKSAVVSAAFLLCQPFSESVNELGLHSGFRLRNRNQGQAHVYCSGTVGIRTPRWTVVRSAMQTLEWILRDSNPLPANLSHGGANGNRTRDLLSARQAHYQAVLWPHETTDVLPLDDHPERSSPHAPPPMVPRCHAYRSGPSLRGLHVRLLDAP